MMSRKVWAAATLMLTALLAQAQTAPAPREAPASAPASKAATAPAPAPKAAPPSVPAPRDAGDDRFVAGGKVLQTESVSGDFIAAGGDLAMDTTVGGDAVMAGGDVRITGRVGQDLYAAGGELRVEATVNGNARVAGGDVQIAPSANLEGNLSIAGGDVAIRGPVKGHVRAAGGEVEIDSRIGGDVYVAAGSVRLGPNARIGGKLTYRSGEEIRQDPAAQVAGGIERGPAFKSKKDWTGRSRDDDGFPMFGFIWMLGLVTLAALFAGALPSLSQRVGGHLRSNPPLGVLLGLTALIFTPFLVVLLMITIIGIPLGLLVLLLYFGLLLVGYVVAAVTLGDYTLARFKPEMAVNTGWRIGAAMVAVVVLSVLGAIPFIGNVVSFIAMLAGVGAIVMTFLPRDRAATA